MNLLRQMVASGACLLLLAAPALAADCHRSTKEKLALVDAPQADRDQLCSGVAVFGGASEDSFTARDFANLVAVARRLRAAGYHSPMMYLELIGLAGVRGSAEMELVANVYVRSSGCVTPQLLMDDMNDAVKRGGQQAIQMFRGWDRKGFVNYLAMVSRENSCTIK